MQVLNFVFVLLQFSIYVSAHEVLPQGYYWRDYYGIVPSDAVVAGTNNKGVKLYIGQAYIRHQGLLNGQIFNGRSFMLVQRAGKEYADKHIKILCGPPSRFRWVKTSTDTFDADIKDKVKVIGGHEDGNGECYVGRYTASGGQTYIGRINKHRYRGIFLGIDDAQKAVQSEQKFEILIYQ